MQSAHTEISLTPLKGFCLEFETARIFPLHLHPLHLFVDRSEKNSGYIPLTKAWKHNLYDYIMVKSVICLKEPAEAALVFIT